MNERLYKQQHGKQQNKESNSNTTEVEDKAAQDNEEKP
jgi:hypothetical protein